MHLDMVVVGNLHHDIKDKYSTCINFNMAGLPRMSSILVMLQWGCAAYCLRTFFVQFQHGLQCSEELHIGECNARRTNAQLGNIGRTHIGCQMCVVPTWLLGASHVEEVQQRWISLDMSWSWMVLGSLSDWYFKAVA